MGGYGDTGTQVATPDTAKGEPKALHNACALLPEARARCGNSARRDLCGGGGRVNGIPTATDHEKVRGGHA
jgi:hypothetical protein